VAILNFLFDDFAVASNGKSENRPQAASQTNQIQPQDPEVAKKIRKLSDKLAQVPQVVLIICNFNTEKHQILLHSLTLLQISKLKAQQTEGKKLEVNQLDKISKEKEILDELRSLRLNS
jgi:hypothetical protein